MMIIISNFSEPSSQVNQLANPSKQWNEEMVFDLSSDEVGFMDDEQRHLAAPGIVFTLSLAIWSYLIFVLLSPKPKCYCKTSLIGKTVVITGGSDGIGKVTAIELAKRGAHLILPCRNLRKGHTVAKEICKLSGNKNILVLYAELEDLKSVQRCSEEIKRKVSKIDILINNAGIGHGVGSTYDGFPKIFGVNHIGPFLLTTRLLPLLRKSGSARIIFVSSVAHLWGNIDFNSIEKLDNGFLHSQFQAYARSKLANVLFAKRLATQERRHGVTTFVAHPGWTFTAMFRDFPYFLKLVAFPLFHLFLYLPEEGAQTQIHLALAESLESQSGSYFVSCRPSGTCPAALDGKLADDLWLYSERAVGSVLSRRIRTCTSI